MKLNFSIILWFISTIAIAQTRVLGHIATDTVHFVNTLWVANASAEAQTYHLLAYSDAGTLVGALENLEISSLNTIPYDVALLFPDLPGYLIIEGSSELTFSLAYESKGGGSVAYVHESSDMSKYWRIYPGNWEIAFDGLAILNLADEQAQVTVSQRDTAGNLIQAVSFDIAAKQKAKRLLNSDFKKVDLCHFEISSSQDLVITSLSGSYPENEPSYLWVNPAFPASPFVYTHIVFPENEDGEFQDILTPEYYQTPVGGTFRSSLNQLIYFSRRQPFSHPLAGIDGSLPPFSIPAFGLFGALKGPEGFQQYHMATDFHIGNNETDVPLFAAFDGTITALRDAPKYRHVLYLTKEIKDFNGQVLGKLVVLYAHIDLDNDEAAGMLMDGKEVHQGDLISQHLYAETVGGPHLHFEIRYLRPNDDVLEEFYGGNSGPAGNPDFTSPSAGPWTYGSWHPQVGYGFSNPNNFGLIP